MRNASPEQVKRSVGRGHGRGGASPKPYPDPQSRAGRVYALLNSKRGYMVEFTNAELGLIGGQNIFRNVRRDLEDFYGLDIRTDRYTGLGRKRGGGKGRHRMMLAGEWFGRVYIDYVAEAMEKAEKK